MQKRNVMIVATMYVSNIVVNVLVAIDKYVLVCRDGYETIHYHCKEHVKDIQKIN